jgi:hypothetical protein
VVVRGSNVRIPSTSRRRFIRQFSNSKQSKGRSGDVVEVEGVLTSSRLAPARPQDDIKKNGNRQNFLTLHVRKIDKSPPVCYYIYCPK